MAIRLVMLGDVVGMPGVLAIDQVMAQIRDRWQPDLVIANAENAHQGSGLTPVLYKQLMDAGVDAMTLGDHVYKKMQIANVLKTTSNIIRPANLSRQAVGSQWMRLSIKPTSGNHHDTPIDVYVMTVLGRIFSNFPADDPFEAVETVLGQLPDLHPIVLVEVHAEATSEKKAMGYFLDGRVSAVVGTHTHVATADACILAQGTAYITDIGMCGPHESVLGRRADRVLTHMTTAMPAPFDVAEGDPRVNGVFIEIDTDNRRAQRVERIELAADPHKPPFANN